MSSADAPVWNCPRPHELCVVPLDGTWVCRRADGLSTVRPRNALANQRRQAAATVEAAQLELAPVGEVEPRA